MQKKEIEHYCPYCQLETSWLEGLVNSLRSIFVYKELIRQLVLRDLFSLYRRSFLGVFWIILAPVFQVITWLLLKKTTILNPGEVDVPYPLYVLIGTLLWGLFISVLNSTMNVFQQSRQLLMRIKIPFEVLFLVQIIIKVIPFLISVFIIALALIVFRYPLSLKLLLFPFSLIPLIFMAAGLGMLFSLLTSLSFDLKRLVTASFNFLMFFTPIVYSIEKLEKGFFKDVVLLNPLSHILLFSRDLFIGSEINMSNALICCFVFSLTLLFFSWRLLSLSVNHVLERIY